MTTSADIVNRSLQLLGTRTTVSAAELSQGTSNEAIQAALVLSTTRDQLLRMAPWNFCDAVTNLVYLTSACGTPENQSHQPLTWQRGLPLPPWLYEYAYPADCARALAVLAQPTTPFNGVPIYPVPAINLAPLPYPQNRFKVASDKFYPVNSATVVTGGSAYLVGDVINLTNLAGTVPLGAPAQLLVTAISGPSGDFDSPGLTNDFSSNPGGAVTGVEVLRADWDFNDTDTGDDFGPANPTDYTAFASGGYFQPTTAVQVQASTTGTGTGASFTLSFAPRTDMRVVLCNQEQALLKYAKRVIDPAVMDDIFIEAWTHALAAQLCLALTGDKNLANLRLQTVNRLVTEARVADANEECVTDDRTPDWLRARGVEAPLLPYATYDWGPLWPML